MKTIEEILELKKQLCVERDSLANLYNELMAQLVKYENNPEIYDEYVKKIRLIEEPSKITKEKMREYNRVLRELGHIKSQNELDEE
jgi:hypothetical protein